MALYLKLLKFVKPYYGKLIVAMIFMCLLSGTKSFTAWFVKPVMDKIFFEKNETMLVLIPLGVILLFLLRGVFDYAQAYLMGFVGQRVVTDIRNLLFLRLQRQPLSFFDKTPTGLSISRIVNDVNLIQGTVSDAFTAVLIDALEIIGLIFVVFSRDWKLATISFLILPFATFPIIIFGKKQRKVSILIQKAIARLTSFLHETITGQRIVKAFSMEAYEEDRFKKENNVLFRTMLKRYRIRALSSPVLELLGGIAVGVIIWYGGGEVIAGRSTPGTFFSFTAALIMLYEPVKKLNKENHNIQQGLAASQRVFEFIDREPEIDNSPGAVALDVAEGNIEFENVYFKYEDKMILNSINLRIRRNEVLAVVGESGAGKTTLVNLIPRFYDVSSGSIKIDGLDVRDVTLSSLRKQIALVTQDVILFNDTILSNIAYGSTVDNQKIEEAATMAYAHDFITRLPKGYDTIAGEKGVRLSGGQKQRIAIARAIYKNAPILILDEATSALDTASEVEVQRALENLIRGRTTIVIAHRLSTIMNSDRIIVIENGTIVEEGAHNELLQVDGPYHRLYELQFMKAPDKKIIRIGKRTKNV